MSRIINFHAVQSVPASLLNRDDNNSAKGITIGNVRRDRVSSQSWKRAIRTSMRTTAIDDGVWANRTKLLPSQVVEHLVNTHGHDHDAADQVTSIIFKAIGLSRTDKGSTSVGVYAATTAPADIAQVITDNFDALATGDKIDKTIVKAAVDALDINGAIDLALFGRMLAELPAGGRVDGAVGVSHAFGITPTTVEPDFFTAVDDCHPQGESGMLGVADLTAPIFYRHAYLDRGQLAHNLAGTPHLTRPAEAAFTRHMVTATPSAKSRSTAAHTLPDLVLATTGPSALSMANAYTTPIVSEKATRDALRQMFTQLHYLVRTDQVDDIIALPLTEEADLMVLDYAGTFNISIAFNLDDFIDAIAGGKK